MPVSEDELDPRMHSSLSQSNEYRYSGLSKAEQRKNNKPIMEKRRRSRINQCLNELKALILDVTNKDPARHTKLEKADILEMTVKHLQSVQRQHLSAAIACDHTVVHKFKTGFNECAVEVSRYIGSLEGIDNGVKKRLLSHLTNCISDTRTLLSLPPTPNPFANSGDLNNNRNADLGATRFPGVPGLQLIPSRLPSGELALLLPNASSLSSLFPNTLNVTSRSRISAFTPVSKDVKSTAGTEGCAQTAYENSHSEVSSTSNDGTSFKAPYTPAKSSRTNYATGSSLLIPVTELNPQYKKDRYSLTMVERNSVCQPLTVYTDPGSELVSPSSGNSPQPGKSPLDFSLKKESEETTSSANRLPKKRPLEDLSCNIQPSPTKSIKLNATRMKRGECDSRKEDLSAAGDSAANADMWRPW